MLQSHGKVKWGGRREMKASCETHESVPTPQLPEKKKNEEREILKLAAACVFWSRYFSTCRSCVFGLQSLLYMYIYT